MTDLFGSGERVVFLQGIGGIGKTEIAKQYAKRSKDKYDTIVYATYPGSLQLTTSEENAAYSHMLRNLSRVILLMADQSGDKSQLPLAKEYAQRAMDLNDKWQRPGDPGYNKVPGAYMQMADVYIALEEYEKAMALNDDAYEMLYGLYGEDDPDTLDATARRAALLYHTGRYQEALELSRKNIDKYEHFHDEAYIGRFEQLMIILNCLTALGQAEEANTFRDYVLTIGEKIFAPGSGQLTQLRRMA